MVSVPISPITVQPSWKAIGLAWTRPGRHSAASASGRRHETGKTMDVSSRDERIPARAGPLGGGLLEAACEEDRYGGRGRPDQQGFRGHARDGAVVPREIGAQADHGR